MSTTRPTVTVEIDFTTDLSAGFSYYEKVLTDGPYLYYRLKETAGTSVADVSGNGRTGTSGGTITWNLTSGKPVTGETASRYIDMNAGAGISFTKPSSGTTAITLEAFVYRSSLSGSSATFYTIAQADEASGASDWLWWSVRGDGKLNMKSGYCDAMTSTSPIAAATWYHVACVLDADNDEITFYVNGVAQTTTYSPALDSNRVGFQQTGDYLWYFGSSPTSVANLSRLAEPALYTTALSAAQLLDHYNARATTPFSGYAWTNVTSYLDDRAPVARRFGRETGLTDVTPMEFSFTLLNRDRRFEPEYTSSPYYPNVEPGRPCRITMVQDAVTYDWAFGFIQDFPQEYPQSDLVGSVPIVATDFLERMNSDEMSGWQFSEQLAGSRIGRVLNIAGVPQAMRAVDAGANTIMAQSDVSGATGEHSLQVARTDRGLFFFDGRGYAVFQDGTYRTVNTRSINPQGELGHGQIDYEAPDFHSPLSLVRNDIRLRRPGGVEQQAIDGTSKGKYGRRTYQDELLLVDDSTLAARAAALLADNKDPALRIRSVTFTPTQGPGYWNHSLGVKISDRYDWTWDPLQGTTLSRDVIVEGVQDSYAFQHGEYLSTWFLSLTAAGNQVVYPLAATAFASASGASVFMDDVPGEFRGLLALLRSYGGTGPVTVAVTAATAQAFAPGPSVSSGAAPRVGLAVQGGSNVGGMVRAVRPMPGLPVKEPVPGVFVFVYSAPPIFNVITAGGSNQGYRFRGVVQTTNDARVARSSIQQR